MTERLTPARQFITFLERIEPRFSGNDRRLYEVIGEAFGSAPAGIGVPEVQAAQLRHLDTCRKFLEQLEATKDAKRVCLEAVGHFRGMIAFPGIITGWQQHSKAIIPQHKPQLFVIDTFMQSGLGYFPPTADEIDSIEVRLQGVLDELETAGVEPHLLQRLQRLIYSLMFGLRHVEVMGRDAAWDAASAMVMEIAASPIALGSNKANPVLKKLIGIATGVVAVLAAGAATTSSVDQIMANVESIGQRAVEWGGAEPKLIEHQPDAGTPDSARSTGT